MDHGGMDHGGGGGHGGMDHGGGGHMPDMPGMPMPEMCNMNMVWNWDTTNLCILTSSWRITTPFSLYVSLAFIAFAGVLYEWLRLYIRRLDAKLARRSSISSSSSLLAGGGHRRRASLLLPTSNPSSSSSSLLGGVGDGGSTTSGRRGINVSKRRSLSTATGSSGNRFDDREEDEEDRGRLKKWVKPLETSHTAQIWRSTLHATSIGISFILMLIGMTFNAWIIMAIIAGAGLGHYWFNRDLSSSSSNGGVLTGSADDKGLACHL